MIDHLFLTTNINVYDALRIKEKLCLGISKRNKYRAYTCRYAKDGVKSLGVWINRDRMLDAPSERTCMLNAVINGISANNMKKTIAFINGKIDKGGFSQSIGQWRIQNIAFQNLIPMGKEMYDWYISLLRYGRIPSDAVIKGGKRYIKNTSSVEDIPFISDAVPIFTDSTGSDANIVISNDNIEFTVGAHGTYNNGTMNPGFLLSLWIKKKKMEDICESPLFPYTNRNALEYDSRLDDLERQLWEYYIDKYFGICDYYSYPEAENMIEGMNITRSEKRKLQSTLKGVAVYKGIDNFISHSQDNNMKYEFMSDIRSAYVAGRCIRSLKTAGINPVTISRRDACRLGISHMENLFRLIENSEKKDSIYATLAPVSPLTNSDSNL